MVMMRRLGRNLTIQGAVTFEHEHEVRSYMELFTDRSCFRRLFLACSIQASVQMTGVSAIQYYSVTIYGQMGIVGNDTLIYQAISFVIALITQFLCILFIVNLSPTLKGVITLADSERKIYNLTNAIFFWVILPETAKRSLK
ncbi:uncharacterized protein K441DRAFT_304971 [Cenococcum geophilum 1.58]|uniref:uncharacterized protein n=1 Tax=Cenococcum geophilum 1.58 TaxID=794803 RepID=UPI00358EC7B4|nr:hypothetical protein K441DRAFT_304971 [Cenococcum geophilum 1.58]